MNIVNRTPTHYPPVVIGQDANREITGVTVMGVIRLSSGFREVPRVIMGQPLHGRERWCVSCAVMAGSPGSSSKQAGPARPSAVTLSCGLPLSGLVSLCLPPSSASVGFHSSPQCLAYSSVSVSRFASFPSPPPFPFSLSLH